MIFCTDCGIIYTEVTSLFGRWFYHSISPAAYMRSARCTSLLEGRKAAPSTPHQLSIGLGSQLRIKTIKPYDNREQTGNTRRLVHMVCGKLVNSLQRAVFGFDSRTPIYFSHRFSHRFFENLLQRENRPMIPRAVFAYLERI